MDDDGQQVALGIYRDMALPALDLLARVVAALPPFGAVLALCESRIATVGVAFLPFLTRLLTQIEHVLASTTPRVVSVEIVEAARDSRVIGQT